MPTPRLIMRKIRDTLRLRFAANLSHEQIGRALNLSKSVVGKYLVLAQAAGIGWPVPEAITDAELEGQLYGRRKPKRSKLIAPDFAWVHQELKRPGVTLQLLWEEYRQGGSGLAYRYTSFCVMYRAWALKLKRSMRQVHRAGEKLFVDYAGQTVAVIDAATGEIKRAQIFVAVLGASNYTFCCATWTQNKADWIGAQIRALEYIGGAPQLIIPDQTRALIAHPSRYEPEPNRSYEEFAAHYGTAVLAARPRKPRDKAKVEAAVLVTERWILARLRNRKFFSLGELNRAIGELLEELNQRPFKKLPGNRRSAFEALDRAQLKPLPATRFEIADWKLAKANVDYHIEVDGHYYSVPHALVRETIEVRITPMTLECFFRGTRVASHIRSYRRGTHTTLAEHMPKAHRAHMEWTPGRLLNWALTIGCATRDVVQFQLTHRPHPEMGYRACLGLKRLAKQYSPARLEAACKRARAIGAPTYRSVASILKSGFDRQPELIEPEPTAQAVQLPTHDNLRGPGYYH